MFSKTPEKHSYGGLKKSLYMNLPFWNPFLSEDALMFMAVVIAKERIWYIVYIFPGLKAKEHRLVIGRKKTEEMNMQHYRTILVC